MKYVAVSIAGEVTVHAPPSGGSYDTFCGLDGDDPGISTMTVNVPAKAKINCPHCREIYDAARHLKKSDFD